MKTKLSFLVLPFFLGLVLTLAIAACSSDSGGDDPGETTESSGGGSVAPSSQSRGKLTIQGFGAELRTNGEIYDVYGTVKGNSEVKVYSVQFSTEMATSNWLFDMEKKPVNGTITGISAVTFPLSGYYIDLTSSSITKCGDFKFWVTACSDASCQDKTDSEIITIKRAASKFCGASSSSGGGATQSSSSQDSWVFGTGGTENISANASVTIGPGSVKLISDDPDLDGTPNIQVNGGRIRQIDGLCNDDDAVPVANKEYSAEEGCLGRLAPSSNTVEDPVNESNYYLVYFDNGDKYLLYFTRAGASWANWPKKVQYWKATKSPQ